jgi:hypothetical protein
MSNIKVTAALLESAGWTEAQIDRYYKLLDRKMQRGLSALSVSDRRFYNSALPACSKAQAAIDKILHEAQTRRVSGKQPVETKLHYRWVETDLQVLERLTDLAPCEVNASAILLEEELRAIRKYQPVLDQIDTSKRCKMSAPFNELLDIAVGLGREVAIDRFEYLTLLKAEIPEGGWNPAWDRFYNENGRTRRVVAIPEADELEFRALARDMMELVTREIYPSVAATVAA